MRESGRNLLFSASQVSDVPLMAGFLQLSTLDWKYKTEPQGTACLGKPIAYK